MSFYSIKNFFKIFLFVSILGFLCYFIIVRLHYAYDVISFEDYNPKSTLVVSSNEIKKSKYPFIDIHNHQFDMPVKDLSDLVSEMDSLNMAFMVNLSGFRGQYLKMCLDNIKKNAPERLGVFVNLNWENIDSDTFLENNIKILRDAKKDGAIGLKVYLSLIHI